MEHNELKKHYHSIIITTPPHTHFNPFVFLTAIIPTRLLIETDVHHNHHITTRIDGIDDNTSPNPNPAEH